MGLHSFSYLCQHPRNNEPPPMRFLQVLIHCRPIAVVIGDHPPKVREGLQRWQGLCIDMERIKLMYSDLTTSSPGSLTLQYVDWSYCIVYGSDRYLITWYSIVVGSDKLITPHLPNCTREAIFSLMPQITNLCTESKSSLDVVLLVNWTRFQLLKDLKKVQYVQSKTGW